MIYKDNYHGIIYKYMTCILMFTLNTFFYTFMYFSLLITPSGCGQIPKSRFQIYTRSHEERGHSLQVTVVYLKWYLFNI